MVNIIKYFSNMMELCEKMLTFSDIRCLRKNEKYTIFQIHKHIRKTSGIYNCKKPINIAIFSDIHDKKGTFGAWQDNSLFRLDKPYIENMYKTVLRTRLFQKDALCKSLKKYNISPELFNYIMNFC